MRFEVNLDNVEKRLQTLPEQCDAIEEVPAEALGLYVEADGKLRLDTDGRDELLRGIGKLRDEEKLRSENAALREKADRRLVTDTVRGALEKVGVKPSLRNALFHEFMATHKFAVTEDGKAIVIGEVGTGDAEIGAVEWAHNHANGTYTRTRARRSGDFTEAFAKIRGPN